MSHPQIRQPLFGEVDRAREEQVVEQKRGRLWRSACDAACSTTVAPTPVFKARFSGSKTGACVDSTSPGWRASDSHVHFLDGGFRLSSVQLRDARSREDGSEMTRLSTDGSPILAAPVLAGDALVVQTRNGGVYAWRPQ